MLTNKEGLWYRVLVAKYREKGVIKGGGEEFFIVVAEGGWSP